VVKLTLLLYSGQTQTAQLVVLYTTKMHLVLT